MITKHTPTNGLRAEKAFGALGAKWNVYITALRSRLRDLPGRGSGTIVNARGGGG